MTPMSIAVKWVLNRHIKANSAFHPSGVGKWVPASAGKAKAGMVHSVSGWRQGVHCAGKTMRSLENACHTWAPTGVFTTRRYTNSRLPLHRTLCTRASYQWFCGWYDDVCRWLQKRRSASMLPLFKIISHSHNLENLRMDLGFTEFAKWPREFYICRKYIFFI